MKVELQDVLKAVDDEPEYPDAMPEDMKKALSTGDIELITETLRITVRLTKEGIRQRIEQLSLTTH